MPLEFSPAKAQQARSEAGLGQREAARRLVLARQTLINAENGDSIPGGDTLARMASLYGVDVGFFFIDVEAATPENGRGNNHDPGTADVEVSTGVAHREV